MRVWLASYPRSGNTFFRIILSYRYGLPSDGQGGPPESWNELRQIDSSVRPPAPDAPQFVKTHALPGTDLDPAIYLVRDGRDALVSYAYYVLAFDRGIARSAVTPELFRNTLRDLILEMRSPFGTWAANAEAWMTRPNTAVVRYEELVADPFGMADRALKQIGLALKPVSDSIPTFAELNAIDPNFFRKGGRGGNRDEFPAELRDVFWAVNGPGMRRLGYAPRTAAA